MNTQWDTPRPTAHSISLSRCSFLVMIELQVCAGTLVRYTLFIDSLVYCIDTT
jgi:hypothetical protein